jgi:single-strand DNA-binding protein
MSVNKVILIGNLGKDPEIRYISDNVPVANFSIATSESYKDKNGEWQEATEWHNVVAWRNLAERAEKYLKKGKQVYVEGKIRTRSWDDKDGNKRYTTEIVADTLQVLGKREEGEGGENEGGYSGGSSSGQQGGSNYGQQQEKSQPSAKAADTNMDIDDDLPF